MVVDATLLGPRSSLATGSFRSIANFSHPVSLLFILRIIDDYINIPLPRPPPPQKEGGGKSSPVPEENEVIGVETTDDFPSLSTETNLPVDPVQQSHKPEVIDRELGLDAIPQSPGSEVVQQSPISEVVQQSPNPEVINREPGLDAIPQSPKPEVVQQRLELDTAHLAGTQVYDPPPSESVTPREFRSQILMHRCNSTQT
jgi:hypothetical protein